MTFSFDALLIVGILALIFGALIGAMISRTVLPPTQQKDLEIELQASRSELEQYQQDVAKHFAETSMLVSNLTQAYKDVHDHLSSGAISLTNAEISKKILEAGDGNLKLKQDDAFDEASFEPPKDWAPKKPGQAGTLSEEFGLRDNQEEDGIETTTATENR